jgi:hypothetical protein
MTRKIIAHTVLLLHLPVVVIMAGCNSRLTSEYGLPIALGSSSHDAQKVLGRPDEIVKPPRRPELADVKADDDVLVYWYYSSGVVGLFDHDELYGITLYTFCDYQGFVVYTGSVVHSVKLTDSKTKILQKLGKPIKVENDPIRDGDGSTPNVPVVWPSEGRYYWRFPNYTVCATFLNQAQKVSDNLTWPKDGLISILVKR